MTGEFRIGPWLVTPRLNAISRNGPQVHLEPKVMDVLVSLATRNGETVSREELLRAVWPNTFVTDDALTRCVSELRRVLEDDIHDPHFIETIPKRGYRMVAQVELVSEQFPSKSQASRVASQFAASDRHSVGRDKERAALATAFESAIKGRGLLACVVGEPGIGKSTLVQDFLSDLQARRKTFSLAVGRCSQRLAGEEAYLPFLEALESLVHSDGNGTANKLRALAPSWYAQVFPLSKSDPSDVRLREYVGSTTQERMKRELAAFIGEITRQMPLVLFFDDVHWTDPSTVDLLAYLGTKFDKTKILVIVTYRPAELLLLKHPFLGVKLDLQAHNVCRDIEVEFLSLGDVQLYIALEFPENRFPREFAEVIHSRTEGNPLFMVDLLSYLRERRIIVKVDIDSRWHLATSLTDLSRDIPQSVSSVIERKIEQACDRDRQVLAAAAIQGYEFDSAAVACALEADSMEIEERLERLDRISDFVKHVAENDFPNRTLSVRYRFVHVLYQDALFASVSPTRRAALSAGLASALETFYGEKRASIAPQLGFLYEHAHDPGRASDCFLLAAKNAQRIFANQEAITLARRGMALLQKIPVSTERTQKELSLQVTLAFALLFLNGYTVPEVQENMAKAQEICGRLGGTAQLAPILFGLWLYYIAVPELSMARGIAEQLLEIAGQTNDPALLLLAHTLLGITLVHQGDLAEAHRQLELAIRNHDPTQHGRYIELFKMEPGIYTRSETVRTLWMLGYPDQALQRAEETLALARTIPSPTSLAYAFVQAAFLCQSLHQPERTRQLAEECIALCNEHGVVQERSWIMFPYGWAVAQLGEVKKGTSEICSALNAQLSRGNEIGHPQYRGIMLAEAYWHAGQREEGLKAVEDGLAISKRTGNVFYDAELLRLKGEFLKMQNETTEAESCFQEAIEIARQQAAKSLELRASSSLARVWQKQGRQTKARQLLGDIYAWFTEGFDTADLREAASLLDELSQSV